MAPRVARNDDPVPAAVGVVEQFAMEAGGIVPFMGVGDSVLQPVGAFGASEAGRAAGDELAGGAFAAMGAGNAHGCCP